MVYQRVKMKKHKKQHIKRNTSAKVIIRKQILSELDLCGISGCFLFMVLSRPSRVNNHVWINDPGGEAIFYLTWMLINPAEIVSVTYLQCNTVCGPERGEITAQKPLICKVGTPHHPASATPEVAEAASADAFH